MRLLSCLPRYCLSLSLLLIMPPALLAQEAATPMGTASNSAVNAVEASVATVDEAASIEVSASEQLQDEGDLSDQVADLKQQLINLNRDLFILEEDLLFPATTQLGIFVSMDIGQYFKLDSVELRINNQKISSYLYTEREVKALFRGGVQRYFMGNLKAGKHQISAFFIGYGPKGREYKRGATLELTKDENPVSLELKIVDSDAKNQPVFEIKQW